MERYRPPIGTVPTLIHDIYGDSILVYFPREDKESPLEVEKAIRQAQLNGARKEQEDEKGKEKVFGGHRGKERVVDGPQGMGGAGK